MNHTSFEKSRTILEYDKVLAAVALRAPIEGAREQLTQLMPSDDPIVVKRLLAQTAKAKEMLMTRAMPSFGTVRNVLPALDRASKGAVLTTRDLLDIAALLRSASSVKHYPASNDDPGVLLPFFEALGEVRHLEKHIGEVIAAEDMIADTASDTLYRIRRDMRKCESSVREVLAKYTAGGFSKYLQENIVTMRNGRFVVPVKAEFKNEIKGLVHDTSASGATLFIEPLAVLDENNRLRELRGKEADEIDRILAELSTDVSGSAEIISRDYQVLNDLASIFAKADYAYALECISPKINEQGNAISLISARHPLLDKKKVVPISVTFGGKDSVLVITGPNTGGKTVTLKTIGLFAMMAQSGLELPADDGTTVPIFDAILPDIGDEQSIEQSLSTFSAHMVNIVGIIERTTSRSLVLFDELGAGTDPTEGAALAVSILEEMKRRGAVVAATTHYAELKTYALDTPGVLNASCEFDVETLRPTYRLILGLPGKSNAFAISQRLGIPAAIIERAKGLMSEENVRFEDILSRLEETEGKLGKEKERTEQVRAEAEKALNSAKAEKTRAEAEAQAVLDKAREQANRMLISAKASADYVYDELNELKRKAEKEKNFDSLDEARRDLRQKLRSAEPSADSPEEENQEAYVPPRPFRKGDEVTIAPLRKDGILLELNGEYATVQAGIIKTKVKLTDLRLSEAPKKQQKQASTSAYRLSQSAVKNEIDVRGETGDDAYFIIDRYLDSAVMAGYENISIIHGKGTGALRASVWQHLKSDRRVASFRSGRYGEGDTGVTIVTLKK